MGLDLQELQKGDPSDKARILVSWVGSRQPHRATPSFLPVTVSFLSPQTVAPPVAPLTVLLGVAGGGKDPHRLLQQLRRLLEHVVVQDNAVFL